MMHWQGLTDLTPRSYTPLALMNEDPPGIQVKSDSPYKTVKELADAIKASPAGKFKASGTGQGGIWHLALIGWLTAMGLKPESCAVGAFERRRACDAGPGGWRHRHRDLLRPRGAGHDRRRQGPQPRDHGAGAQPAISRRSDAARGDGHRLRHRRLARLCRPERVASADCHEAHGRAEESLRLARSTTTSCRRAASA